MVRVKQNKIPDGWEEDKLKNVALFRNGKAHERDIVDNGSYVVVNSKYISSEKKVVKYSNKQISPLSKGDVVMVMSDVPNGKAIAKCLLIDSNGKYTLNQRIGNFKSNKIHSQFLYFLLNRNRYFLSYDDGVNQTNLRKDDILACPLIFPHTSEQNKIIDVLKTWDLYLEKLDKKIEANKQIKKGLMQQLLTGKRRLPGFSGKWKEFKLGDIYEINPKNENLPDEFMYIDLESVQKGELIKKSKIILKNAPSRAQRILRRGDVLFQTVRPYQRNNYYFDLEGFFVASTGYAQFRTEMSSLFLYYLLHMDAFVNNVLARCTGSNYPAINSSDLSKIIVKIPVNSEQSAIAEILTTADNEIAALEKQRNIIADQKKFLLNNLLTGEIRLTEFVN